MKLAKAAEEEQAETTRRKRNAVEGNAGEGSLILQSLMCLKLNETNPLARLSIGMINSHP